MTSLKPRKNKVPLDLLVELRHPAVDQAMLDALPWADAESALLIVKTLLARATPVMLVELVRSFAKLPKACRRHMVNNSRALAGALRNACASECFETRQNAINLMAEAGDPALAYLAADLLQQSDERLHPSAADSLLQLAETFAVSGQQGSQRSRAGELLARSLADACRSMRRHGQTQVITALMQMGPVGVGHWPDLLDGPHAEPLVRACRETLAAAEAPAVCRRLSAMLVYPTLRHSALAGLTHLAQTDQLRQALVDAHLFLLPAVREVLQRHAEPQALLPALDQKSDDESSLTPPAFVMALPLAPEDRAVHLASYRWAEQADVRLAALRGLVQLAEEHGQAVDSLIAPFTADEQPAIARLALWHLIRSRYRHLPDMLSQLVASPHRAIRRLAGLQLAPVGFARLWEQWSQMDAQQRDMAGRAMLRIDPQLHRRLGRRLATSDRHSVLQALAIIHHWGQSPYFEPACLRLAGAADRYIAASAVRCVGQLSSSRARQTVAQMLCHDDPRVRANAVEALDHASGRAMMQRLKLMGQKDNNRARANAIGQLMQVDQAWAVEALRQMLADPRPRHRQSALWLVGEATVMALMRDVAERAVSDPDASVRRRAEQTTQLLMGALACRPSA